jgi:hypothetical protein
MDYLGVLTAVFFGIKDTQEYKIFNERSKYF